MDDTEQLEYPMYQALWRTQHNGEDALAFEWPAAPIVLFLYRCGEVSEVQELCVPATPPEHTTEVGWFFTASREQVRHICASGALAPPAGGAETADDWIRAVSGLLLERSIVFWKGDTKADLVAFGALDEQPGSSSSSEPDDGGGESANSEHVDDEFAEVEEPEIEDAAVSEGDESEPVVSENEASELPPTISEPEIMEPEVNDPEIYDPEIYDPEIDEPEIDEYEISEYEISESAPASQTEENKDEISYDSGIDSGLDDMEIDWFDTSYTEPQVD
ncbi:hypothetical protein A9K55_001944 [Cordyceps militaris]|uniref:Uncharacterized protein n=1 Tax=Cordyceps militaris TaxID=73501 RepID=A0A2H4SQX1_CORMI|nr:hypothetical protein A9K55_001944 [Cordyceps militaris]